MRERQRAEKRKGGRRCAGGRCGTAFIQQRHVQGAAEHRRALGGARADGGGEGEHLNASRSALK